MRLDEITAEEFKQKLKDPVMIKVKEALATFESTHGDTWEISKPYYDTLVGKEIIVTVYINYRFDRGMKTNKEERSDIDEALAVLSNILPGRFHNTVDFSSKLRIIEINIWLKDL